MTSDRPAPGRRKLSDLEAERLAYNLLMDAIDSDDNLQTLKGKAQTLFREFGIELSDEDLQKIEPDLGEMLKLGKDRGLWGRVELAVSKGRQTTGAVLEGMGKRMKARETPGLSDIAGHLYVIAFSGSINILMDTIKALLVRVDSIAKKLNVSLGGKHFHLSSSKRDMVVARIARKINAPKGAHVLPLDGATPTKEPHALDVATTAAAKRAARRIVFTGRGMEHAARVSKSQDQRRAAKSQSR